MKISRILKTNAIILLATFVGYLVRLASGQFDSEFNLILFVTSFIVITITWELFRNLNIQLNKFIPFEKGITQRIVIQLVSGALIAVMVRFTVYALGEPYLPMKLDSMFLASTWVLYILAATAINSIFITRYFIDRWKDSLVMTERLEKEKALVQFDNLKNQLNPHFLFNALTSLNSLISENPTLASEFLQQLSRVYRYVLQNKDKNFVSVGTELDFISNYVFLMETRFGSALKINIGIPDLFREKAIVPVTLQILIENALKHNIVDAQRPLTIDIYIVEDYLIVGNNLQLRKVVETSNKQGLDNLKSLYKFLTDRPIEVERDEQRFSVRIPLL